MFSRYSVFCKSGVRCHRAGAVAAPCSRQVSSLSSNLLCSRRIYKAGLEPSRREDPWILNCISRLDHTPTAMTGQPWYTAPMRCETGWKLFLPQDRRLSDCLGKIPFYRMRPLSFRGLSGMAKPKSNICFSIRRMALDSVLCTKYPS